MSGNVFFSRRRCKIGNGDGANKSSPLNNAFPAAPNHVEGYNEIISELSAGLRFIPDAFVNGPTPKEFVDPFYRLEKPMTTCATITGQISFPMSDGQANTTFPIKFSIDFSQKLIVDQTLPGPVINKDICQDTLISGRLAFIQVVQSNMDATISINGGTPLPMKGKRNDLPADPNDPQGFFPGFFVYANYQGGLTSVIFNSLYQMKIRAFLFA